MTSSSGMGFTVENKKEFTKFPVITEVVKITAMKLSDVYRNDRIMQSCNTYNYCQSELYPSSGTPNRTQTFWKLDMH